jgi:5-methylcytosine-specific restriction protein A
LRDNLINNGENIEEIQLAEEVPTGRTYCEGSVQQILVNRYERDTRAREDCIRYYGTKYFLCQFDFSTAYGNVMDGFIHVHHIKSRSSLGAEYEVDPINDLRPVCPNCHTVLHRRDPPYELDDVREFLNRQ